MRLACFVLGLLLKVVQGRWTIIIDAGSSGSRVHVYEFGHSASGLPLLTHPASLKVSPGLSAFAEAPEYAGQSLVPLLSFAALQVPAAQQAATPIQLMATAGLRIMAASAASAILSSCAHTLAHSTFRFEPSWAFALPGSLEGVYGFLAANYASGALQSAVLNSPGLRKRALAVPDSVPFMGVLELGGASAQVSFKPSGAEAGPNTFEVQLAGLKLRVHTHSFLGFGQDTAQALAASASVSQAVNLTAEDGSAQVVDPCLPTGYAANEVVGGGNFGLCRAIAAGLLAGACNDTSCPFGKILPLEGHFVGIENFAWTARFLGLPETASLAELEAAGQQHCSLQWPALQQQHEGRNLSTALMLQFCFSAAYIVAFLHTGLQLGMEERRLTFANALRLPDGRSTTVDWPLGAAILQAARGSVHSLDPQQSLAPIPHIPDEPNRLAAAAPPCLMVLLLAALVVRWLHRVPAVKRMLRRRAGGTVALAAFEQCTALTEPVANRRASKPG